LAVVRKSEFAKIANVTKGNVSHWLMAGHISGAAIVGEGRMAMIDVELAMAQLRPGPCPIRLTCRCRPEPGR
jgi:hypothetical protein